MTIRELRIRYAVPEMFHQNDRSRDAIHAIVCNINTIKGYVSEIKKVGYKIIGYDERYREEKTFVELNEGWTEIIPEKKGE